MRYMALWLYFGCMCVKKADVDKLKDTVLSKLKFS